MKLLSFGMKYRRSRNPVLRLAAKFCITMEKWKADKEEQRLKKLNIKEMDEKTAKELLDKMNKKTK